jgi:hypothetical protein
MKKETQPILVYFSRIGRKTKYLAVQEENQSYPAVYFRKSKYVTQEVYERIIEGLKDSLPNKEEID